MGYQLRRDLREALGPDITGLQRAVALEIADDANDNTRESWAALEDLARWTAAKDTNVVRNALKRLSSAGWEFRVQIGTGKDGRPLFAVPGRRMTFLVPKLEGVATATPKEEPPLPHGVATATPSTLEGVATAPSGVATATHRGSPRSPLLLNNPSTPHVDTKDSPAAEEHLEAFGAFWVTYPKKRAREEAKKAWIAAIKRGASPDHIVDAAQAYARERAQQDPKYTKYPATWLNKGCYDDEPEQPAEQQPRLRAVSGGWQPWTNPDDQSAYYDPM